MKKRIILASIILALIPLAIRAIGQPKYSLLEANVEALLTPETGGEVVKCYCKTHWFSPNVFRVFQFLVPKNPKYLKISLKSVAYVNIYRYIYTR